jgi:hypothetical protein
MVKLLSHPTYSPPNIINSRLYLPINRFVVKIVVNIFNERNWLMTLGALIFKLVSPNSSIRTKWEKLAEKIASDQVI